MRAYFADVLSGLGPIDAEEAGLIVTTELTERSVQSSLGIVGLGTLLFALASWAALVVAVAMLFRYIGPVRVSWTLALLSATMTSALLYLGTVAISWYLRQFGASSVTGAFGAVLVALSFVYYEAQILLAGVQLVKVLTSREDRQSIARSAGDEEL